MISLLDPRVWLVVAAVGAGGYLKGCSDGQERERNEHLAQTARANAEARRLENARQSAADAAARASVVRQAAIAADAARARAAVDSLRDALNHANRAREESAASAAQRAAATGALLEECSRAYQELGRAADGHVNDLRTLLEAWPK